MLMVYTKKKNFHYPVFDGEKQTLDSKMNFVEQIKAGRFGKETFISALYKYEDDELYDDDCGSDLCRSSC